MFPKLQLPPDILDCGLSLASGPSYDDYDLSMIPEHHPNVYGCGLVFKRRWPGNYIVTDYCRWRRAVVSYGFPSGLTVWALRGATLDKFAIAPSAHRPANVREIPELPDGVVSASIVTTHAALSQHKKVYLLGIDGGHCADGTPRRRRHGIDFGEAVDSVPFEEADRLTNSIVFPLLILVSKRIWDTTRLVNLSTTSLLWSHLPVSHYSLAQPYGRIDRYARLMVVYVDRYHQQCIKGLTVKRTIVWFRSFQATQAALGSRIPNTPTMIVSTREAYDRVVTELSSSEVIHGASLSLDVRSQFTHIIKIGARKISGGP